VVGVLAIVQLLASFLLQLKKPTLVEKECARIRGTEKIFISYVTKVQTTVINQMVGKENR
jgi:hypothetical protein